MIGLIIYAEIIIMLLDIQWYSDKLIALYSENHFGVEQEIWINQSSRNLQKKTG